MIDSNLDKEILSYVTDNNGKLIPSRCSKRAITNHGWNDYLMQRYDDFTSKEVLKESLYRLTHNIEKAPNCYCGNTIIFKNNSYSRFCSPKCRNNDSSVLELNKKHVSESLINAYHKHGDDIKLHRKITLQQKYDAFTSSPFSSKIISNKAKNTIKKQYGVNNILQLDKCRIKSKESQRQKSGK